MKEMSYIDRIYNTISVAYSVNFMVLQNLERLMPSGDNNVFMSADVFGEKSSKQKDYEVYYTEYADIRSSYFKQIKKFLNEYNQIEKFQESSRVLLNTYNQYFNKDIKYSTVFSDRDIKNWEEFKKIYDSVNTISFRSSFYGRKLQYIFGCFLNEYETYKNWLTAYEIIEALESDITEHGSKSLYFEKPNNPNLFLIEQKDYQKYAEIISKFLKNKSRKNLFNRERKSEGEVIALKTIADYYNRMEDRFESANSHVMSQGNIFSKIHYHLSSMSDGDYKVTRVYTHRNEILSLITALLEFPELYELANDISIKFLGKNVENSQNSKKENT